MPKQRVSHGGAAVGRLCMIGVGLIAALVADLDA
jgi:hypothetical protein